MTLKYIIIGIVVLIAIILIIKFVAKKIFKVLAIVIILAGVALYGFFKFGSDENDIKFMEILTKYSIQDLENVYCKEGVSRTDSLKCYCIIKPISTDLHSRFSESELNDLQKKRLRFAKEIIKSISNKKSEIKEKLKDNNALHLLDEFKQDLINRKQENE